jgi:hypothetical protein
MAQQANGPDLPRGRRGAFLADDAERRRLIERQGARLTALKQETFALLMRASQALARSRRRERRGAHGVRRIARAPAWGGLAAVGRGLAARLPIDVPAADPLR